MLVCFTDPKYTIPYIYFCFLVHSDCAVQAVTIQGVSAAVFDLVLGYIYRGRLDTAEVELLKGTFLAANMLQIPDLELLTVSKLHKAPQHILSA